VKQNETKVPKNKVFKLQVSNMSLTLKMYALIYNVTLRLVDKIQNTFNLENNIERCILGV
jgi:hypothetical protein